MKIKPITKNLVDIFLPPEKHNITGYDESLWLRLQRRANTWVQIAGISIPSWKFKLILEKLK